VAVVGADGWRDLNQMGRNLFSAIANNHPPLLVFTDLFTRGLPGVSMNYQCNPFQSAGRSERLASRDYFLERDRTPI